MKSNNKTQSVKAIVKDKVDRPERLTLSSTRELFYETFRTNLRMLCGSLYISDVEVSKEMKVESGARLTALKYGRGNPTVEELTIIAKYFNVTIDDIMNKKGKIIFE